MTEREQKIAQIIETYATGLSTPEEAASNIAVLFTDEELIQAHRDAGL